ncbi:MAG: hypothetical protein ACYC4Q_07340 [Victivallaceae bacterium]
MVKKVAKNNIRQRGSAPKLSDAEVITMKIVGESLITGFIIFRGSDTGRLFFAKQQKTLFLISSAIKPKLSCSKE